MLNLFTWVIALSLQLFILFLLQVFVIDSGRNKLSDYDSKKNVDLIQSDWISLANARQRMGVCFRLYSRTKRINIRSSPCFLNQENGLRRTHSAHQDFETWQSALFLERIREPPVKRIFRLSLELLVKFGALDSIILWSALPHLNFTWLKYRQILVNWFLGTIFGCIEGLN